MSAPPWSSGVMPARVWARGIVSGLGPVVFGGPSDPDYQRPGWSHDFNNWPDYAYAHYVIQQGVKWETGVGEFDMTSGIDTTGGFVRLAVQDSSAGAGVSESFENDFCDIAIVPTASSNQQRLLASYGDGSDGDVTIGSSVVLTRNMFYNNLTFDTVGTINTSGYAVFVAGILACPGSRVGSTALFTVAAGGSASWVGASSGSGASVGGQYSGSGSGIPASSGQAANSSLPLCLGGRGGAGSAGSPSGNGGVKLCDLGASGGAAPSIPNAATAEFLFQPSAAMYAALGGSAGGGGGADSTIMFGTSNGGAGGSGGAPGGLVQVFARTIRGGSSVAGTYNFASANGNNGFSGGAGFGGGVNGTGGNGGGGGGGALVLVTDYVDRAPWGFQANGGNAPVSGGTGGTGGGAYCFVHGTANPGLHIIRDLASAPVSYTGNTFTATLSAIGASA